MKDIVQPSVQETAFACPQCGAFAKQEWATCIGNRISGDPPLPRYYDPERVRALAADRRATDDDETRKQWAEIIEVATKAELGFPFTTRLAGDVLAGNFVVQNLFVSTCFNCKKTSIWVCDKLVYPAQKGGAGPNPDMPADVLADFEEARAILSLSPRGAAALLRLSLQKLCKHLGESGKDINADIGSLVQKGLDPVVQQALDAIRVIGNESVHPGEIDMTGDRATALELFDILNLIVDQRISQPRKVAALYARLPQKKLEGIAQRDARSSQAAAKT